MMTAENKNVVSLFVAALVLVTLNMLVWTGVQNGQLTLVENTSLWIAFAILDVVSLVWAFSMLGLQPMVLALSYTAGGFIAFQGVQGATGVGMAEATTAGATYGAFGAMVIGHATTKNRLGFFRKEQVPFVFVFVGLLLLDGVLNSRVTSAGQSVIINALVFPLTIAGMAVGLVWLMASRLANAPLIIPGSIPEQSENRDKPEELSSDSADEPVQMIIKMPNHAAPDDEPETEGVLLEVQQEEEIAEIIQEEPEVPILVEDKPLPKPVEAEEQFFPLEIDKDDDFIEPFEAVDLMDIPLPLTEEPVAAFVPEVEREDTGSSFAEEDPLLSPLMADELLPEDPDRLTIDAEIESQGEPEAEPVVQQPAAEQKSEDWLNGHLDLLSKIKTND